MASARLFLYVSLAFVSLLLWERWVEWNRKEDVQAVQPPSVQTQPRTQPSAADDWGDVPVPDKGEALAVPSESSSSEPGYFSGERVVVVTDLLRVELGLQGGDIRGVDLLKVPVAVDLPDQAFRLLSDKPDLYWLQSGLLHDHIGGGGDPKLRAPSHHEAYRSDRALYEMVSGEEVLRVPLLWQGDGGISVEKTYILRRGSYLIEIEHKVINRGGDVWVGRQYAQLRRSMPKDAGSPLLYTFTGAAYYDGKYNKVAFDEITEGPVLSKAITGGWAAMLQHYFVSALIPDRGTENDYYTKAIRELGQEQYLIGLRSPPRVVAPGTEDQFSMRAYLGPKLQARLSETAPGLELTTDYGIFTVISKPLFWLLSRIHTVLGNWGWAIVVLTLIIKLVFYKLSEASYRSMAKMRRFQPRMVALRERYKDDRSRLSEEMMNLYRKEKVNPLGGCLPILVQVPVFIALYWVLLESVELRQAPFILWIHDLSVRDPYFVLPLLMGASMVAQNKLNPTPPDPMQARLMMLLPVVFTVFFAFFPAGLVLYWVVNNVLSISQQWVITRRVLGQPAKTA